MEATSILFTVMLSLPVPSEGIVGEQVALTGTVIHNGTTGPSAPKAPVQPPYVTLDDHTLYIWSQHGGYTLTLLDDDDTVVYQQRHVPIYRSRCIITAPVHINNWQKEVAASVIPSVASSKKES